MSYRWSSQSQEYCIYIECFWIFIDGLGSTKSNDLLQAQLQTVPLKECNDKISDLYKKYSLAEFKNGIDESQVNIHTNKIESTFFPKFTQLLY